MFCHHFGIPKITWWTDIQLLDWEDRPFSLFMETILKNHSFYVFLVFFQVLSLLSLQYLAFASASVEGGTRQSAKQLSNGFACKTMQVLLQSNLVIIFEILPTFWLFVWDWTDVTLVDEDTNSILWDNETSYCGKNVQVANSGVLSP